MSAFLAWARVTAGVVLGVLLLVLAPVAVTEPDASAITRLFMGLGVLGFALLAAGWGLAARWAGPGGLVRGAGLVVFGLAMVAFVVRALPLAGWLAWLVLGLAYAAIAGFVAMLLRGDTRTQPLAAGPDGDVLVAVARGPTAVLMVLALVMAGASLVILPAPVVGWVVGPVGVLFFGGAALWLLGHLVRPGPAVVVDAAGIEDRSSLTAVGRLAWSEIERVAATAVMGQPMVAITPVDGDRLRARLPAWKRLLLAANRRLTRSQDLFIPASALPCSAADLANAINERRRQHG